MECSRRELIISGDDTRVQDVLKQQSNQHNASSNFHQDFSEQTGRQITRLCFLVRRILPNWPQGDIFLFSKFKFPLKEQRQQEKIHTGIYVILKNILGFRTVSKNGNATGKM